MQDIHSEYATAFDSMTTADERYVAHKLYIAWKRNTKSYVFGIVGTSTVNNCLVRGDEISVITPIDSYVFDDESEHAMALEYDRILEEPLGGISYCIADIKLDNTTKRYTPEFNSTIGTVILPNRPVKIAIGFEIGGAVDRNIIVFKGLTQMPKEDKLARTLDISGFDYVSYLNELQMDSQIYTDERSDEIIEKVLIEAGLGTSQYELDEGLNTIGFAWFSKDMTAGERIKQICEAEEGHFYQDESGMIRFDNRRKFTESPYSTSVWTIEDDDIMEWQLEDSTPVYNRVIVSAKPREVGDSVEIWKDGITEEVEKGEAKEIWASFDNPCSSITTPVATTDFVANSASDGTGDNLTSDVSIALDDFAETAKLTITNNSGKKAYITYLRLRGTPATITSEIEQIYEDSDSVAKYDEKVLKVENDFIDDDTFAYYLARALVQKYKSPLKRIKIKVRGIPHLQLRDKVTVYDRDLETTKDYRVMRIQGTFSHGGFEQWLTLREVTSYEADSWAVVGTTQVGAEDEFVGI